MSKILIVGAGITGATCARFFADAGDDVKVIDERKTIGGNLFDYVDKNGIRVQSYGPHVFHTNDQEVFDFLSRYTEWEPYTHKVNANVKGKLFSLPIDFGFIDKCFEKEKAKTMKKALLKNYPENSKVSILELRNSINVNIKEFADYVYTDIFYTYTKKQWRLKPEQLDGYVINNMPIVVGYSNGFFSDKYQCMPKNGFTEMITEMLRHPNIKIQLESRFEDQVALIDGYVFVNGKRYNDPVIFTGCVDRLFNFKYGVLPYRSLKFKLLKKHKSSYQEVAVTNYTRSKKYLRVSEFTKFTCAPKKRTVILKEYSAKHIVGENLPYYPIPTSNNDEIYAKYVEEVKNYKNLYLVGRLAEYKYMNMDVAVKNALNMCEKIKEE